MKPLSLRAAIELCEIPDHMNEYGVGKALREIITETNIPLDKYTVQERYAAICHYITAQEQGDWEIAEIADKGKIFYSDYPLVNIDYPEDDVYRFTLSDEEETEEYIIVPLTGEYIEAAERYIMSKARYGGNKRGDWVVGAMAAQIRLASEPEWDGVPDELVAKNYERLLDLPEIIFNALAEHYNRAQVYLRHAFNIGLDKEGVIIFPKEVVGLPPTRFPFTTMLGETTISLWKEPRTDGSGNSYADETRFESSNELEDGRYD